MTVKEICECIYNGVFELGDIILCVVESFSFIFKWLFLIITTPLWIIPYTIIKQNKKGGADNGDI